MGLTTSFDRMVIDTWHNVTLHICLSCWVLCAQYLFINSIGVCRMRRFPPVLRSFFHSSLLRTFSCYPSPPTILPSSLNSACHLFLGLPLNIVVSKFIYNTLLRTLFSSTLCTCPNQRNPFNLTYLLHAAESFLRS